MALDSNNINFLLKQLRKSSTEGFISVAGQIFNYLSDEVKDNPVYDKYEASVGKWKDWIKENRNDIVLPTKQEETNELAYTLYREIAQKGYDEARNFILSMFYETRISNNYARFNEIFVDYFASALSDIFNANPETQTSPPEKTTGKTVFIIHGHDDHLKTEVQLLMHRAGVKSIVLHEVADQGRHTLDKLIEESKEAGYVIALLTPDDLLEDGKNRARQNVILEIGYFLGRVGKARVRMIVKESVEIPSDLDGILYQRYDSTGGWKGKLMKEMQAVGIYVDMKAVIETL